MVIEQIVKLLLDANAEVDFSTNDGVTPLYLAVQNGHEQVVKLLLDKKANVNLPNKERVTPLYVAVKKGCEQIVELLIKEKAEVNLPCMRDSRRFMRPYKKVMNRSLNF